MKRVFPVLVLFVMVFLIHETIFTRVIIDEFIHDIHNVTCNYSTVYWKEGFIEKMGIIRNSLPENCVNRDYKWWDNNVK